MSCDGRTQVQAEVDEEASQFLGLFSHDLVLHPTPATHSHSTVLLQATSYMWLLRNTTSLNLGCAVSLKYIPDFKDLEKNLQIIMNDFYVDYKLK